MTAAPPVGRHLPPKLINQLAMFAALADPCCGFEGHNDIVKLPFPACKACGLDITVYSDAFAKVVLP